MFDDDSVTSQPPQRMNEVTERPREVDVRLEATGVRLFSVILISKVIICHNHSRFVPLIYDSPFGVVGSTSRMNADYYVHVYLVGGKKSLKEHDSKLIIV